MATSVFIEYREDCEDLCDQTVHNSTTGSYVTGYGPGPAMTRWLQEHGGRFTYSTFFDVHYSFYPEGLEIEFQEQSAALLFKLTWG